MEHSSRRLPIRDWTRWRLELEITETVLLEKNEKDLAMMREIKDLGASIVLDDFGVGYSSMTYLQLFPFDKIKIDRSFMQNMLQSPVGAAIVCALASLGRHLDIATIAEGIETVDQVAFLRAAGCRYGQGYLCLAGRRCGVRSCL